MNLEEKKTSRETITNDINDLIFYDREITVNKL
jgi:hypothetical protein